MSATTSTEQAPIYVSPEARRAMAEKVREWTGWRDGSLKFGAPDSRVSPYAMCEHDKHLITVNPEHLILNPNRVLLTVTPFRLRQEAVLTGAILHEAGHARHTHWKPRTIEELTTKPLLHGDGTVPTKQAIALAKLMEEPRVEGLMYRDADSIGALGLGWTMRASAARLIPRTDMSVHAKQAMMDLLTSWALRAGRQAAINYRSRGTSTPYRLPAWVGQFTSLLHQTIEAHLIERIQNGADLEGRDPNYRSLQVIAVLISMIECDDDTGTTMIDSARDALALLFPETPADDDSDSGDESAMPGSAGCGQPESEAGAPEDNEGEGDEPGADGEGNTEPEDEGSVDDPGAGDSGQDEAEEDEAAPETGDQGEDGPEEGDEDASPGEGGSAPDEAGASDSTERSEQSEQSALAQALAELEAQAQAQTETETGETAEQAPPLEAPGTGAGAGSGGFGGGGWRQPDKPEREIQKGAEHFLRSMLDASESMKRSLSDQPAASVDGAALAAWKAGGQVREPHFFVRTRRISEPSPPIKIAILVDISSSMDELQGPSALLSWALSAAALDLRNFAGRGQQIESCLIHWGDDAKVIQSPGQTLPGIREVSCMQGTSNMHGAMQLVEEVMPGFYDVAGDGGSQPVNRLLVQFTDWKLFQARKAGEQVSRALAAGVNMLSVVPSNYSYRYASLSDILRDCPIQRGAASLIKYNPSNPGAVWSQAAEALSGNAPDAAAAYGF